MGLSVSLWARAFPTLRALGVLAQGVALLGACRPSPQQTSHVSVESQAVASSIGSPSAPQSAPSAAPHPSVAPSPAALSPAAPSPAAPPHPAAPAAPATNTLGSPELDPASSFLVGTQGESVSLRSLDGQTRTVVPAVSSWLYDPAHGLLWFLDEERLGVADLRDGAPPTTLGQGIPAVGSIWVEWPQSSAVRFVRPETGCEESADAVELELGGKPALRLVEPNRRRSLSREGLRWLQGQAKRTESPAPRIENFDPGARRVALPKGWSGCDDVERCGSSAAFGAGPLRLVLVRDDLGADCFHRGCLLFDPKTKQFASPPVLVDAGGTPSLAPPAPRWTSAREAAPGSCGPYAFDAAGTAFLAHRFLCRLDESKPNAACEELPGEGIGWLRPGLIAGGPG